MRSIVVSTIVFLFASFFIKRQFEGMGLPKGMTRNLMVFCLALAAAYGAAAAVDWIAGHA